MLFVSDYDGNISAISDLGTADLSFEINPNFLNELMMSSSLTMQSNDLIPESVPTTGGMEVDQDVAGWLDSLLPNQSPQSQPSKNTYAHDSGIAEMNGNNETFMYATNINSERAHSDPTHSGSNNNGPPGTQPTNTHLSMAETQSDSFLGDTDMMMSTLQSPLSVHDNF